MKCVFSISVWIGLGLATGFAQTSAPPVIKISTTVVARAQQHPATTKTNNKPASLMQIATLQTALDRNGFGVGFIDGQSGSRTTQALRDYAQAAGMSEVDARETLLSDDESPTNTYAITEEDLGKVGTAPTDWEEAATVPSMACGSLDEVLSEQYHVSRRFLQRLNPGLTNWAEVKAGAAVVVPNSRPADWAVTAARLEVDCTACRIRVYDATNDIIASFPCSIAKHLHKVPVGDLKVVAFAPNPNYTFDPENFPESARAKEIGKKLIIPPGPRNPVGVYWLSLSAPGFGMHGTPHPETIGRRESHGCFRLTNWDIQTLAGMVEAGTPVKVMNVPVDSVAGNE